MTKHRIYTTSFASVYPHYITKAEKKGRTKPEVDEIIRWLTGYSQSQLEKQLTDKVDFETFFEKAPAMNPTRKLIKGVICGIRVEEIEETLMQEIRYLDKLIDELARGKTMEKILRTPPNTASTTREQSRLKSFKGSLKWEGDLDRIRTDIELNNT